MFSELDVSIQKRQWTYLFRQFLCTQLDEALQASFSTEALRQTPGEANALGELKIMFPNKHAIYMHDTPSKSLFNRDARAFSHGCVRLQQPREMAAAVLGTTIDDIRRELAAGHSSRNVPVKIPVYVAYFTAWPQEDGTIGFFTDVYERDDFLTRALDAVREARSASS